MVKLPEEAVEYMKDGPNPHQEVLSEVNLSDSPEQSRPVIINSMMAHAAKARLIASLYYAKENKKFCPAVKILLSS